MPSIKRSLSATPSLPPSDPDMPSANTIPLDPPSTPPRKKIKGSSTSPTGNDQSSVSYPLDVKPTKAARSPAKPKTASPKKAKATAKASTSDSGGSGGGGGKKMGSWSGDELKRLYHLMCPKRVGVNWTEIAQQIEGRDAKACNNKWTRMQGKLEKAIEELGE